MIMGLDMYLVGKKQKLISWEEQEKNPTFEDGYKVDNKTLFLDLGYWRKHPNLHGYIVQTFAGGKDECQEIPLSLKDLEKIVQAVKDKVLPQTAGFFFGTSYGDETEEDLRILNGAIEWLKGADPENWYEGRCVFYRASW